MPILGSDVPKQLVEKTRQALIEGINKSEIIRLNFPDTKIELIRTTYSGDYTVRGWTQKDSYFKIAKFGILPMPGCKGICIFHHVEVEPKFRGKGIGKELLKIRQSAAKQAGYSLALATVKSINQIEKQVLYGAGWDFQQSFTNSRTRNWVDLFSKVL